MNYGKLQLSFILLTLMCVIQLFVGIFVVKKIWLICSSLVAVSLCIAGLIYSFHKEAEVKEKK